MKFVRLACLVVGLGLVAPLAQAQQPPHPAVPAPNAGNLKHVALTWATKRNLPVREIEVGPPDRRTKRLFVPVPPEHWADFVDTLGSHPRALMFKLKSGDNHLWTIRGGKSHLWAREEKRDTWNIAGIKAGMANDDATGPTIVASLTEAQADHVDKWFAHRANPADLLYNCGNACMDFVGNIEVGPAADGTNTLRPIGAAEIGAMRGAGKGGGSGAVPAGVRLFDALGIARSKDGRNMVYNLIHAATEQVQVVAIPVGAGGARVMKQQLVVENGRKVVKQVEVLEGPLDHFAKMTDAELLGPLPPQGVAGVVRPAK
jgi:hypothetical protein